MIQWVRHGEKWLEKISGPGSRYQVWRRGQKWAAAVAHWSTASFHLPNNLSMHDTPAEAMAACNAHQQSTKEAANG